MADILVIGSANIDLVVTTPVLPSPGETLLGGDYASHPGGKGANQAVAAARAGGDVAMIGRVGNDAFGERLLDCLRDDGVAIDGVLAVEGPSGVALIMTAPGGSNMIVVAAGANGMLGADEIDVAPIAKARFVLAQLETPLEGVIRAAEIAQANGSCFILDPAPARPLPRELFERFDWLTPNESEARTLLGLGDADIDGIAVALQLRAAGAHGVVVKMGARGAVLLAPGDDPIALPAYRVAVVDTTAAGDAFNGAFAVALAEGKTPGMAAQFAIAASALAVTKYGAQPSIARRPDIEKFIENRQFP